MLESTNAWKQFLPFANMSKTKTSLWNFMSRFLMLQLISSNRLKNLMNSFLKKWKLYLLTTSKQIIWQAWLFVFQATDFYLLSMLRPLKFFVHFYLENLFIYFINSRHYLYILMHGKRLVFLFIVQQCITLCKIVKDKIL